MCRYLLTITDLSWRQAILSICKTSRRISEPSAIRRSSIGCFGEPKRLGILFMMTIDLDLVNVHTLCLSVSYVCMQPGI
jgi:hypothetical protein